MSQKPFDMTDVYDLTDRDIEDLKYLKKSGQTGWYRQNLISREGDEIEIPEDEE